MCPYGNETGTGRLFTRVVGTACIPARIDYKIATLDYLTLTANYRPTLVVQLSSVTGDTKRNRNTGSTDKHGINKKTSPQNNNNNKKQPHTPENKTPTTHSSLSVDLCLVCSKPTFESRENTNVSAAILYVAVRYQRHREPVRDEWVSNTSRANPLCSSLVKSEPTRLHPEETKFEIKKNTSAP